VSGRWRRCPRQRRSRSQSGVWRAERRRFLMRSGSAEVCPFKAWKVIHLCWGVLAHLVTIVYHSFSLTDYKGLIKSSDWIHVNRYWSCICICKTGLSLVWQATTATSATTLFRTVLPFKVGEVFDIFATLQSTFLMLVVSNTRRRIVPQFEQEWQWKDIHMPYIFQSVPRLRWSDMNGEKTNPNSMFDDNLASAYLILPYSVKFPYPLRSN